MHLSYQDVMTNFNRIWH